MPKNLADLALMMDRLAACLTLEASRAAIEAGRAIVKDVAFKTPVDTSAALSNWQACLDSPNLSEIGPYVPGHKGSTKIRSANITVDANETETENKKPGQIIFISNSIPYIRDLNAGLSNQEPAGFVERAVIVGRKSVKRFKMNLRF